jgi:HD-like signal output (HDOD) protein
VTRDAALAADFLHLSNSALFRRGEPCTRVWDAIQRLGTKELICVISLSLSKNVFGKDLANYGITANQHWAESVWAALFMESLADGRRVDPSEAYVVGILHQIGKVLINEAILEAGWKLFWDGRQAIEVWEADHVGFTHAEAGKLLLERWEFPETIVRPIAEQMAPPMSDDPDSLTSILRFTRLCLSFADPGNIGQCALPPLADSMAQWFGFRDPREVRDRVDDTTARLNDIKRGLSAD